ncbi:MAG: hypothetical protein KF773_41510 [Deltaproteobacteria bacterium]|nr:hypothetical protein [Deltaproteobacteria bacterium]
MTPTARFDSVTAHGNGVGVGEQSRSFKLGPMPKAAVPGLDNPAVDAQLKQPAPINPALAHDVSLERGFAEVKEGNEAIDVVRGMLMPAYRRAVDAMDARAALELAQHVVGALRIAERSRHEAVLAVATNEKTDTPDPRLAELRPIELQLVNSLQALEAEVAIGIGPQVFRGHPVLGSTTPPRLGKDPLVAITGEAGATCELVAIAAQACRIAGVAGDRSVDVAPEKRKEIVALIEPWKSRPVNFAFLVRVLFEEGVWDAVASEKTESGKTLAQTQQAVDAQAKQTGALNDIGTLDGETVDKLLNAGDDWLPGGSGETRIARPTSAGALELYERMQALPAPSRAAILRRLDASEVLDAFLEVLPWQRVKVLHDHIAKYDIETAALLAPYYQDKGGRHSLHEEYMQRALDHHDAGNPVRARAWFVLDYVSNVFTAGFHKEYSDAFDEYQQGLITEEEYQHRSRNALAKAGLVIAASAAAGGVGGAYAGGLARGAGLAPGAATVIAGAAGGTAAGLAGHATGDVFDQAFNGKDGFDSISDYARSGAIGGLTGTVAAGLSLAAGRFMTPGSGQRPIDAAASKYPRLSGALERIRAAINPTFEGVQAIGEAHGATAAKLGTQAVVRVRMTVSEVLELIDTHLSQSPNALATANGAPIRTLPGDTLLDVSLRPSSPLTEPMQMSTVGEGKGAGPTELLLRQPRLPPRNPSSRSRASKTSHQAPAVRRRIPVRHQRAHRNNYVDSMRRFAHLTLSTGPIRHSQTT